MKDDDYDYAAERFFELESDVIQEMASQYRRFKEQPWELMSAAVVSTIWKYYATHGFVRQERELKMYAELAMKNIVKLWVNTILVGHTSYDPVEYFSESVGKALAKSLEKMALNTGWIADDAFSDYAFGTSGYNTKGGLQECFAALHYASTAEERLQAIDRLFNVVHMRGDLSRFFIEGGKKTLFRLSRE